MSSATALPGRNVQFGEVMTEFLSKYARLSDGELLQIATDRESLTPEATLALDSEMGRRKLTLVDLAKHERFVRQRTQQEVRRRRRKLYGRSRSRESLGDGLFTLLWAVLVIALIWIGYIALPGRYHFSPDWEETAVNVMLPTVFIAVTSSSWRRRIAFWLSLIISSTIHALLLHMWIIRFGAPRGRGTGHLAVFLGVVLFFAVYGCGFFLSRKFSGEEVAEQ